MPLLNLCPVGAGAQENGTSCEKCDSKNDYHNNGNFLYCYKEASKDSKAVNVELIVGVVVGGVMMIGLSFGLYKHYTISAKDQKGNLSPKAVVPV